jgi:hypothetical protein
MGGRSEQGVGCSRNFGPLEEALAGGSTMKRSSDEERCRAERKTE